MVDLATLAAPQPDALDRALDAGSRPADSGRVQSAVAARRDIDIGRIVLG